MQILINLVAFKIGWLASVFGAANDLSLLGPLVIGVAIFIHLQRSASRAKEMLLILVSGAVGVISDSLLLSAGWMIYPTESLIPGLSPLWILGLWMLFATTFNTTLKWLQTNLPLAAVIGAASGPLSYYFGEKLGAVEFSDPTAAMVSLAVVWGGIVPALIVLARRLEPVGMPVEAARS